MTKKQIDSICKQYGITDYTINPNGSIDVKGSVYLINKNLTKLPLKFGKVTGSFNCNNNQLTSLDGSPISVDINFSCLNNNLTSLEGSPSYVGGHFHCSNNRLIDYTELLNIDITGGISINSKSYITKQDILIMVLNDILKPYDLVIDSNYVIKDVFGNIVVRSSESKLKNDIMELINV